MKLTKKLIEKIESQTNCSVRDEGDYWIIYVDNSAGEDYFEEIQKGKEEVEELLHNCDNFDPEDHFSLWYGAHNGEPQCPGDLWNNCVEIAESLDELAYLLREELK